MSNLKQTLNEIEVVYSGLRSTAKVVLVAAATTRLARRHPFALVLIGAPSSGKTSVLMPLARVSSDFPNLKEGTIRVDDFSTASLLSHSANRNEEQLKKIDLLPKLANRVVIVKEMAPFFSGKEDELNRKFSIFASVMDGEGLASASGSHGRRSYEDPCIFTLLGAVTYDVMKPKVFQAMSAIGPRFNFWTMPNRDFDPLNWKCPKDDRVLLEKSARISINTFLENLFLKYPVGSIEYGKFNFPPHIKSLLEKTAGMMAIARSRFSLAGSTDSSDQNGENENYAESPERAYFYLEQTVLASALLEDRFIILESDLAPAIGIAIGSAFSPVRRILSTFLNHRHNRGCADIAAYSRLSEDTARKYIRALVANNLLSNTNADGSSSWNLAPELEQLREIWLQEHGIAPLTTWDQFIDNSDNDIVL